MTPAMTFREIDEALGLRRGCAFMAYTRAMRKLRARPSIMRMFRSFQVEFDRARSRPARQLGDEMAVRARMATPRQSAPGGRTGAHSGNAARRRKARRSKKLAAA